MRKINFQTGEYYHIYNRGVDKRDIFVNEKDYMRFLTGMREFNDNSYRDQRNYNKREKRITSNKLPELSSGRLPELSSGNFLPKLVDIICYCLNRNHYHFILKQVADNGIKIFMHKLGTGHTNYFNLKHGRNGALFQGPFKAVRIESDDYLLHLCAYINGNAEIHGLGRARNYQWSSYKDYLDLRSGTLCNKKPILSQFKNITEFEELVEQIIKDSSERKEEVKRYLLE